MSYVRLYFASVTSLMPLESFWPPISTHMLLHALHAQESKTRCLCTALHDALCVHHDHSRS